VVEVVDMDYNSLFVNVRLRPQMYGLDGSFQEFCAFLNGVDAGNAWKLLVGFREMLVVKLGFGANLTWPALVVALSFPQTESGRRELLTNPDNNRTAVDMLFDTLAEFRQRTAQPAGLLDVFEEYLRFRRAK
jgi:hypothetical protein